MGAARYARGVEKLPSCHAVPDLVDRVDHDDTGCRVQRAAKYTVAIEYYFRRGLGIAGNV